MAPATPTSSIEMEFSEEKRLYCTPALESFGTSHYLNTTYTKKINKLLNIYYTSVNVYIKLYNWSSKGK